VSHFRYLPGVDTPRPGSERWAVFLRRHRAVSPTLLALTGWAIGRNHAIRDTDDPPEPVLFTDPIADALRRGRGGRRGPTHMGE